MSTKLVINIELFCLSVKFRSTILCKGSTFPKSRVFTFLCSSNAFICYFSSAVLSKLTSIFLFNVNSTTFLKVWTLNRLVDFSDLTL